AEPRVKVFDGCFARLVKHGTVDAHAERLHHCLERSERPALSRGYRRAADERDQILDAINGKFHLLANNSNPRRSHGSLDGAVSVVVSVLRRMRLSTVAALP